MRIATPEDYVTFWTVAGVIALTPIYVLLYLIWQAVRR